MLFPFTRSDRIGNGYLDYFPPHNVFHCGIDYNHGPTAYADYGQDVLSPTWGVVEYVSPEGTNGGLGNHLVVRYPHHGVWARLLHLEEILVSVGQKVAPGQLIARLGDSGTTSAHLHAEVLNEAGLAWIKAWRRPYGRYPTGLPKATVASMWLDPEKWVRESGQPAPGVGLQAKLDAARAELTTATGLRKNILQRLIGRILRLLDA